jgi:hypothetical protein
VTELEIPVYFFEGKYDYTCADPLAKDYFEKLKAPVKGFYTFEKSAHTPLFEETEKTQHILQEDVGRWEQSCRHKIDGSTINCPLDQSKTPPATGEFLFL